MSEDVIDLQENSGPVEVPPTVKTLAIISIVGSSLWSLLLLIGGAWLMMAGGAAGAFLPGLGEMMGIIALILLLMIGLNVMGIIGANKMMQGKKSGFTIYVIGTGIWALLLLLGASEILNLISAILSIGFIIGFGSQLKNLR